MDRAVCDIHDAWGAEIDKQASEADPLRRPTLMEMQLAEFKKAVRKIKNHAVQESDEWHMDACYAVNNCLRKAAVENKQAAIKGIPCISEEEAIAITRMVLALRGIHGGKQIEAWGSGEL